MLRNRSHSRMELFTRRLILVLVCLFTLSIGIPAFAGPPITYTVTFSENDSVSDSVGTYQGGAAAQNLTLFSNLSPKFSNPGYTFTGWNSNANGSGTSFSNGESYSFAADMSLYAQWLMIPITYTVTFSENDSVSDSVGTYQNGTAAQNLTLF